MNNATTISEMNATAAMPRGVVAVLSMYEEAVRFVRGFFGFACDVPGGEYYYYFSRQCFVPQVRSLR